MKCVLKYMALAVLPLVVVGCSSSRSPYDYMENWVVREDAMRTFHVPSDLIYLQSDLYTNLHHVVEMQVYADAQVRHGRFDRLARVFSPLIANADDLNLALEWYFEHHHDGQRPFVFIGEGTAGNLLREYENLHREDLVKKGLVASYYSEEPKKGFITDEMVHEIRTAVNSSRYKTLWKRDVPRGMYDQ